MRSVGGAIVLITGAARGMGRLYALRAVREGAKAVVLWDSDGELLASTAEALGKTAHPYVLDLADAGAIAATAALVRSEVGDPDILINNAGIVRGKLFVEHDQETDIALTMAVNALAPMHVTREFLPAMLKKTTPCRVVNIASSAGLTSNPQMSVYSASKWAVVGWSESLRLELRRTRVMVSTICPSNITSGTFDGARSPMLTPLMDPNAVVTRVWTAMKRGTPMLMMPTMVPASRMIRAILPLRAWDFVAGRVFRVHPGIDALPGRRPEIESGARDTG